MSLSSEMREYLWRLSETVPVTRPESTWPDAVEQLEQRIEELEGALENIIEWSKAYPISVFPEPDFKKAARVLKENGMTLDAISASNMRHVVTEVAGMAITALAQQE